MSAAVPIAPEMARRALDLPACPPCEVLPLRVTDSAGRTYVHCPRCGAHTHRTTQLGADTQWQAMVLTFPGSVQ